jgi:CO dehydrogenase/acetyl-CoA synthase beta subunit/intein/homing endonuclease
MIAAEIIEALTYIKSERPYEGTPYCGFIPDKVLRELGIALVDDTIPGCAVLVGTASDPQALVRIVRDCQSKGMLIIASFDTIQQLQEQGIKTGLDVMLYPVGTFTQVIHALNFAIRAALTFGGVQKGDRERLEKYLIKRPKVFVLQLGPLDAIKVAAEFAVLRNGSPVLTDQEVEAIPERFVPCPDHDKMIQTAIEVRGIQVKLAPVKIPVAYGPAFEGETVRRPDTYIEAGGAAKTTAFELLRMRPEDEVEDGKITVIGRDVDDLLEGSSTPLAIIVDVYGKKMQEDFESVLERRIHQFINFAEGAWHTGQRNLIWVRLSKSSVKAGLRFRHFGDILVAKIKSEFGNIVSRVQVTIITDQASIDAALPEALTKHKARDARMAGLTDEAVQEFYSCSLCLPGDENIMLADGSFMTVQGLIEHAADYGPRSVMAFATDHMTTRPMREIFVNPPPKELVQITLRNGNGITLTPNHKVLVDSIEGLKWVPAGSLVENDVLVDASSRCEEAPSGSIDIIDYLPDDYRISDDALYYRLKIELEKRKPYSLAATSSNIPYHRLYSALYATTRNRLAIGEIKQLAAMIGQDWGAIKKEIRIFRSDAGLKRTQLDDEIMYAVGLIASDGCVRWRGEGGRSGVLVQFTSSEPALISRFGEIIDKLFGHPPTERKVEPRTSRSGTLVINSKKLITVSMVDNTLFGRLLNGLGVGLRERDQKWTGYAISALPSNLVAAFLRGLFDGDGHVTGNRVVITARTRIEVKHIHLLMKRLGISSYISKTTRGYQTATSNDGDAIRFREIIGSGHPAKRSKLNAIRLRSDQNHIVRADAVTMACGPRLAALLDRFEIPTSNLPVDHKSIIAWKKGKCRPSKLKLAMVMDAIKDRVRPDDPDYLALCAWAQADVHFQKIRKIGRVPCETDRVFNFSVDETHNYSVNGIVVKNCQSFAPDHICIVTPERLGLCGAINWLDAKASREISPTGPNQPIHKGAVIDALKGQWEGVNQAVYELSHHKLERFNAYTLMEDPMTSCGCFEVIVAMTADAQAVMLVNREFPGMTPVGMKFSTLAGSIGGGKQTPGFIGVGRKYILSKKFIPADGGFLRIAWMPKELKTQMYEGLKKRAEELGEPDFVEKIADETITSEAEGLMQWMAQVDHPALRMPPLLL